ncbi:DUF3310 domain-containing protein [Streptomyces sp. NPDC127112]|uniref:DUF3310 domain-containing protein n=1 Tax=Streptomyces sp. NPDC127112 TaxID=3345364 RepID=UPI00363FD61A
MAKVKRFCVGDKVTLNKQGRSTFPSLGRLTGEVMDTEPSAAFGECYEVRFGQKAPITILPTEIEHVNQKDNVNSPSHYKDGWSNGAEVIDITEHLNFNRGNAVKYIARAGKKANELEDLRKAAWYVAREIKRVEAGK